MTDVGSKSFRETEYWAGLSALRDGPSSLFEFAGTIRTTFGVATRLVACLTERGLVAKSAEPGSTSAFRVALTPKGQKELLTLESRLCSISPQADGY